MVAIAEELLKLGNAVLHNLGIAQDDEEIDGIEAFFT
jgi:hypothetical protein